ncbi:DUF1491 family protein [Paracoccus suum]|uniref:DUF1491 family protein n=1 Tax=Paracoccus suum TaxID=2259340 RepID=A0A344PH93_9RHOB|nr:DUF1491 family protein [Paracoccus suum]AXC48748.1 DUF1491 family protein [Paracoccus suum]
MSTPRLATGLWVSAWLHGLDLAGRAGYVLRRGDSTAGAVLVKCASLDGRAALWARQWDYKTDTTEWQRRDEGTEAEIDAIMTRARAADPDLWLLETEARNGDPMLID